LEFRISKLKNPVGRASVLVGRASVPVQRSHPGSPTASGYPGSRLRQSRQCSVPSLHCCYLPAVICRLIPVSPVSLTYRTWCRMKSAEAETTRPTGHGYMLVGRASTRLSLSKAVPAISSFSRLSRYPPCSMPYALCYYSGIFGKVVVSPL
jgi:hypothetical protein